MGSRRSVNRFRTTSVRSRAAPMRSLIRCRRRRSTAIVRDRTPPVRNRFTLCVQASGRRVLGSSQLLLWTHLRRGEPLPKPVAAHAGNGCPSRHRAASDGGGVGALWNMVVPTSRAGFPWRCDRRRVNHHAPTAVPRMLARIPYFRLVMSVLPKNMSEQPGYQLKPPKLERRQANSLRRPLGRLPFERIRHERDLRRPVPGPGKKVLLVWNSGALILNCRREKPPGAPGSRAPNGVAPSRSRMSW